MRKLQRVVLSFVLVALILLTFLPRTLSLSKHWSSDEDLWMQRSQTFFFALKNGQFKETLPAYHPGVPTMWLGSLALWSTYLTNSPVKSDVEDTNFYTPAMLARVRLPITVVTGLLIWLIGFCVYRLFGKVSAVLSIALLSVEPFLLSESRRAHTDALTALFLFFSFLLWLCALESNLSRRRYIVFSGISFALACLTKSYACTLILFIPLVWVWYAKENNLCMSRMMWSVLLWLVMILATAVVFCPYMWTRVETLVLCTFGGALLLWSWRTLAKTDTPKLTHTAFEVLVGIFFVVVGYTITASAPVVTTILEKMFHAVAESHDLPKLFLGNILHNPGGIYFPVVTVVWSGVLTFPLIGVSVWNAAAQRKQKNNKMFRLTIVLVLFVLFYLIGLGIAAKKISRYLVIFLPAMSILTALGATHLARHFTRKWVGYALLVSVFLLQAVPVLRLHPYYRTYYHPVLSGKWIAENTTCITGAGLDLAADYLNAKPDAENIQVRTTWFSKDFGNYFVGDMLQRHQQTHETSHDFDYEIEYLRDKQVAGKIPRDAPENYKIHDFLRPGRNLQRELEHVVTLNGIDYVWIYRILDSPPENAPETPHENFPP